jgi:methyl-accepting chemotaxis protein
LGSAIDPAPSASGPELAPESAAPVKHKRYIRNYLVDRKLQLRYIGVVSLLSAAICTLLGYLIFSQQRSASQMIIDSMKAADWIPPEVQAETIQHLHSSDLTGIAVMAGVCVGLIMVLSMFLTVMTHKVAGPLFKISMYFDQIKEGKLPKLQDLRKGDEFQDFFKKFKRMTETLRDKTESDLRAYTAFVGACESAGVPAAGELGHGIDELKKLKKDREAALK